MSSSSTLSRKESGEPLGPDTSALTPGPSATGPDNTDGPVPQQPVEVAPRRKEALITQPHSCVRKALITQSRPCVTDGKKGTERIERYFRSRHSRRNRDLRQSCPVHHDVRNPEEQRRQRGGEGGWRRST